jgi:hypothetical protein
LFNRLALDNLLVFSLHRGAKVPLRKQTIKHRDHQIYGKGRATAAGEPTLEEAAGEEPAAAAGEEPAAAESLTADERETLRIGSMVDWTDLLDPNGGFEIFDTACRAITLEQLRKLFTHCERRLKAGEKWNKWTPDDPNVEVTEMDQVICNWETVT